MYNSIVAARNAEKANAVVNEIKQETGNDKVEYKHLDLLSLASVKKFADEFKARHEHLHILMNNAGVMNAPYSLSKDGEFEPYDPKLTSIYFATLRYRVPIRHQSCISLLSDAASSSVTGKEHS